MDLTDETTQRIRAEVDTAISGLTNRLGKPLLIMFYPDEAVIDPEDIGILYQHLRSRGLSPDAPLPNLNVALHTMGGDALASYRLAQLLRDFASEITFLIADHAYSGGTTITLAGDQIILAHNAVLSPIDVGLVNVHHSTPDDEDTERERLEPVAMDHYIDMAVNAKVRTESALQENRLDHAASAVDEAMMVAMVQHPAQTGRRSDR